MNFQKKMDFKPFKLSIAFIGTETTIEMKLFDT